MAEAQACLPPSGKVLALEVDVEREKVGLLGPGPEHETDHRAWPCARARDGPQVLVCTARYKYVGCFALLLVASMLVGARLGKRPGALQKVNQDAAMSMAE